MDLLAQTDCEMEVHVITAVVTFHDFGVSCKTQLDGLLPTTITGIRHGTSHGMLEIQIGTSRFSADW